jgi:hypothetical protein
MNEELISEPFNLLRIERFICKRMEKWVSQQVCKKSDE